MNQMNHHEVYVTQRIRGKETRKLLRELPELEKRVKEIEQRYGVRVTHCTYSPSRGSLLTMKYTEGSDGGTIPAAA